MVDRNTTLYRSIQAFLDWTLGWGVMGAPLRIGFAKIFGALSALIRQYTLCHLLAKGRVGLTLPYLCKGMINEIA